MKYSPAEIQTKTFDRKMMGYDPDQVENYLTTLAAQIESMLQERTILKDLIKNKEIDLLNFKDREQLLQQTMVQATTATEKMKSDTERECKLIINDAHQKSEMITRDAKDSLRKIYADIADLKKARMQFEANLKAMAQAHLSLLDQADQFLPKMRMANIDLE
jgi:cell division initiation protein